MSSSQTRGTLAGPFGKHWDDREEEVGEPILLRDKQPVVDPAKIGISYSGGGPLVLVELGIARALVRKQIVPNIIAGASAGSLAGAAHALDPIGGRGIDLAADILGQVSNNLLGLTPFHIIGRLIIERQNIVSLGDNAPIGPRVAGGLKKDLGLDGVTIGDFGQPPRARLMIVATDARNQTAVWLPDETRLEDALIASSAIPGVFPWREMSVAGEQLVLVDGGVVSNQPLSKLADEGCGTIYACAVGSLGPLAAPRNAVDNAMRAVTLAMHQTTKLEEDYVRLTFRSAGAAGAVHHIHPEVNVPADKFDFTPELVQQVMAEAEAATLKWLDENHPD